MKHDMVGIYVTMPTDLLKEIDELVGRPNRNEFIVDAVRKEIAHLQDLKRKGISEWTKYL